jgi:hypothetical protein
MYIAQREGRLQNPVILEISLDVCYLQETQFSDMNATRNGHNHGKELGDLRRIHFGTVNQQNYFDLSDDEREYYQAEVLVKTWIPIQYITNINNV